MMKIYSLHKVNKKVSVCVYDSILAFTQSVEWQNIFTNHFIIVDNVGNKYYWDETKTAEYGAVYNYILIPKQKDMELSNICNTAYATSNFANELIMQL